MRLISCYIESFGNISKQEYRFDNDLTVLCEANGFGKSTLAAFIKAMLYGMKSHRQGGEFGDRAHYLPFQGGKYGGNLVFEAGGKTYRVERFFNEKSEVKDECTVYCDGEIIDGTQTELGNKIFGLDKDSFERIAFISSDEIKITSTTSMNAKLNNFLQGADDNTNLDFAINAIDTVAKEYKKPRANTHNKTTEQKDRLDRLKEEISNAQSVQTALQGKYAEQEQMETKIRTLTQKLSTAQNKNLVLKDWEHFDALRKDLEQKKTQTQGYQIKYPAGLPTESALAEKDTEIQTLSVLQAELTHLEKREESEREKRLKQRFIAYLPPASEIKEKEETLSEYKRTEKELKGLDRYIEVEETTSPAGVNKTSLTLTVICAIVAVIGIAVSFMLLAVGLPLAVIGAIGVAVFVGKIKTPEVKTLMQRENREYIKKEKDLQGLEEILKSYLSPYGYVTDNGVVADFNKFIADISEYRTQSELERERLEQREQKRLEIKTCDDGLSAFFDGYGAAGSNHRVRLDTLRRDLHAWNELQKTIAEKTNALQEFKRQKNLDERPTDELVDIVALQEEITEQQRRKASLDREIRDDEEIADRLGDLENERTETEELLKAYKHKSELLSATTELLKQAEQNLKEKYVKPVKDSFVEYSKLLGGVLGEKVEMSKSFEVSFESNGQKHDDKYLSDGQKSVCALCFRLAMIENMYEAEKPFLIFDDPFVALDEAHMEKAKTLIKSVAKRMQILYFTCHESRNIR